LIAVFPVLSIYARNAIETPLPAIVLPLFLSLGCVAILGLVLGRLTRNPVGTSLFVSILALAFFIFTPSRMGLIAVLDDLSEYWVKQAHEIPARAMLVIWLAPLALAAWAIFRKPRDLGRWTARLNLFAGILVALPIINVIQARLSEPGNSIIRPPAAAPMPRGDRPLRDIYYIVLDAYARTDVMREYYRFDNTPFLDHLRSRGFTVNASSTSNYCATALSISSSLNYNYLDKLINSRTRRTIELPELIADNQVIRDLRPLGYRMVTFTTGYAATEIQDKAEIFLHDRRPITGFHALLFGMTPLTAFVSQDSSWDEYGVIRKQVNFVLDQLPEVTAIDGPTFTFAHIVCPHPPFVFDAKGKALRPRRENFHGAEDYRYGYRQQAEYITGRIQETIDQILARSPEPPIIILQSDHGPGLYHHMDDVASTNVRERMSILNCFYFPDGKPAALQDDETPVNTFRIVLNEQFGAGLPLLENRNFFSNYSDPLRFIDVTERMHSDAERARTFTFPSIYLGVTH
jgi:hypothetical protein